MNHNPHNLQSGETVLLDKDFRNASQVIIHNFTPAKMYATVYSQDKPEEKWQVMTNRLTPMVKKQTLPKNVEQHLDNSLLFNKFGIVNINSLKASTKCTIPNDELKELIIKRFAEEMTNKEIEFI